MPQKASMQRQLRSIIASWTRFNVQGSASSDEPMEGGQRSPDGEELLRIPLAELEQFIAAHPSHPLSLQSWEALRDKSVGNMQNAALPKGTRLRWAQIAVTAVHRKHDAGQVDQRASVAEEARIRAYTIREFGRVDDGTLRDLPLLFGQVIQAVGLSREEVFLSAATWQDSGPSEMLTLRRIKNLLTPLKDVEPYVEADEPMKAQLKPWLTLISQLP
ncbi:hypothetical protein [Streptomyces sp. 8N616]|uniref:hypothetical protein n=1 Tax=Streptomyces sp. 8N616 TaxID=3457414 RepID=UPI003FCFD96B